MNAGTCRGKNTIGRTAAVLKSPIKRTLPYLSFWYSTVAIFSVARVPLFCHVHIPVCFFFIMQKVYIFVCLFKQSTYCTAHIPKNEKDNELTTLSVFRRVYVNRDENRQVATVMHQDHNNLLRVGSLIFLSVGQLLPHQLQAFHTPNYIYPIGYKIVSVWSHSCPQIVTRYILLPCLLECHIRFFFFLKFGA